VKIHIVVSWVYDTIKSTMLVPTVQMDTLPPSSEKKTGTQKNTRWVW